MCWYFCHMIVVMTVIVSGVHNGRVSLWISDIVQELKFVSVGVKWELDPEGMWTKGKIVLQEPGQSKR